VEEHRLTYRIDSADQRHRAVGFIYISRISANELADDSLAISIFSVSTNELASK